MKLTLSFIAVLFTLSSAHASTPKLAQRSASLYKTWTHSLGDFGTFRHHLLASYQFFADSVEDSFSANYTSGTPPQSLVLSLCSNFRDLDVSQNGDYCPTWMSLLQSHGLTVNLSVNLSVVSVLSPSLYRLRAHGLCQCPDWKIPDSVQSVFLSSQSLESKSLEKNLQWAYAMAGVASVTALSAISVSFFPFIRKRPQLLRHGLTLMMSLAVGSLVGDALMHMLPEAFADAVEEEDDELAGWDHNAWVGFCATLGVLIFFFLEGVLHIIVNHDHFPSEAKTNNSTRSLDGSHHSHDVHHPNHHHHHHHHHHNHHNHEEHEHHHHRSSHSKGKIADDLYAPPSSETSCISGNIPTSHDHSTAPSHAKTRVKPVVYLIFFGDALHNFIDGIAIAASFSTNYQTGISTCLAVLLHEVPHELGDFAVYVSSGIPFRFAFLLNLISSIPAFIGVAAGILATEAVGNDSFKFILAFAAGNFLYVGLANLVPELHHTSAELPQHDEEQPLITCNSKRKRVKQLCLQTFGVAIGLTSMALLRAFE